MLSMTFQVKPWMGLQIQSLDLELSTMPIRYKFINGLLQVFRVARSQVLPTQRIALAEQL